MTSEQKKALKLQTIFLKDGVENLEKFGHVSQCCPGMNGEDCNCSLYMDNLEGYKEVVVENEEKLGEKVF